MMAQRDSIGERNALGQDYVCEESAMNRTFCLLCIFVLWCVSILKRKSLRSVVQQNLCRLRQAGWSWKCLMSWLLHSDVSSGSPRQVLESYNLSAGKAVYGPKTIVAFVEAAIWAQERVTADALLAEAQSHRLSEPETKYLEALHRWAFTADYDEEFDFQIAPINSAFPYVYRFYKARTLDKDGHLDALDHYRAFLDEAPIDSWQYGEAEGRIRELLNTASD
jgi:hypothetical protein